MGRAKAITLIILIQFILLHVTKSQQGFEESLAARTLKQESHDTHEVHCSRERSRAAWQIIDDYLMPFVEEEGYQISADCRLHPDNDLFRDQERHKIHLDVNELRCGYCKKSFRAERFLDQHFDNRHYNLLNVKQTNLLYMATSILLMMLLPLFYLLYYLYQRDMKQETQVLRRVSQVGQKAKPS
ncbi:hypothetical protein ES332_A07G063100v1 [Gossypium tomentosum]|uniref:C2H2-type domain-containing protein n=1 Tax=Gossypium tomentosum TaxID=34277 RepID=A0A5D2PT40_GOSTO|nr:hypothetical protein ES332_A07G063100v1 [Gossypium tomentosum]